MPGCGGLDDALLALLARAELVLFDGTFWTDDELIGLGIGSRTAREMDHLRCRGRTGAWSGWPRSPAGTGSTLTSTTPIPMLVEDSPERREVERRGLAVGADGMRFTL